jgi:hypothetical protein
MVERDAVWRVSFIGERRAALATLGKGRRRLGLAEDLMLQCTHPSS